MRQAGDRVYISYEGKTEDGTVFDANDQGRPLCVLLGRQALPKGLEAALWEMEVGEERTLVLEPAEAFGEFKEEDVLTVPADSLEDSQDLEPGDIIRLAGPKMGMKPVFPRVVSNDGFYLVLDFNHPMAGQTVTYWVKVEHEIKAIAPETDASSAPVQ